MRNNDEEYKKSLNDTIDKKSIINNLMKFCAYQERSLADVNKKLNSYKVSEEIRQEISNKLIEEGFVDNRRFALAYASGKFRNNKWGKIKIRCGLKEKQISDRDIESALNEIDQSDYTDLLEKLMIQKKKKLNERNIFVLRNKIAKSLIMKGFEPDLVWETIGKNI